MNSAPGLAPAARRGTGSYRAFALAPRTIRRRLLRSVLRFQAIAGGSLLLFGAYLGLFAQPIQWRIVTPILLITALIYVLIAVVSYRFLLRTLYSVRVELDAAGVVYREGSALPQRIARADLTAVIERKDGYLLLGQNRKQAVLVPRGLENDGDAVLRKMLERWFVGNPTPARPLRAIWAARIIALGGSALALLYANTIWWVSASAGFLLLYGLWAENRLIQRGERLQTVQRMYSLAFAFVLFMLSMKTCLILWYIAGGR